MRTLNFGYAVADITPTESVEMVGFGRKNETSRGVRDSLIAQVSIWELSDNRCCLIAIDHIGFLLSNSDNLRDMVANELGIGRSEVMLCFSHTHSGPNDSLEPLYFQFICQMIRKATVQALASMSAVRIGWTNAYADIGINRRSDDRALDRRIGILKVVDAQDSSLRLILLRVTAHANVLKEDNYLVSSDYFGTARDTLEKHFHCPIMITQGASGNVSPRFFDTSVANPLPYYGKTCSKTALEDMADEIGKQVISSIDEVEVKDASDLRMYSVVKTLYSKILTYAEAMAIAADAKKACFIDGRKWLNEVKRLIGNGVANQLIGVEIQYFILNEGTLCGVPEEIMTEFAITASERLHDDLFYYGGYTNGCMSYIPTEEEFDFGGYEVYWSLLNFYQYFGHVFPLNRDSGNLLLDEVIASSRAPINTNFNLDNSKLLNTNKE